jgi:hypothetical protein
MASAVFRSVRIDTASARNRNAAAGDAVALDAEAGLVGMAPNSGKYSIR